MNSRRLVQEITPEEVAARLQRGDDVQLIDVRQPWEYAEGHIPGARLLPLNLLPGRFAAEINPSSEIICICAHGIRSETAARFLSAQGCENAATMTGGMAVYPGPVETDAV